MVDSGGDRRTPWPLGFLGRVSRKCCVMKARYSPLTIHPPKKDPKKNNVNQSHLYIAYLT